MTARLRATLNTNADTNLADNTAGDISPADVRGQAKDQADSSFSAFDDAFPLAALNGYLAVSVAANALTIALKTAAAGDPSATDPIPVAFRSATANDGSFSTVAAAAATSLVISSTSTMGFTSAEASRLWIVLFNDAGTLRLGAVNCRSGTNVMSLSEHQLLSSTAEGGAGAADSAQVIYTGSAVTSKAFRILGYLEWASGLTTAGTWDAAPSIVRAFGPGVPPPATIIPGVYSPTGAVATGAGTLLQDDSKPQIGEGAQFMAAAYTRLAAANIMVTDAQLLIYASSADNVAAFLCQDSAADALAVSDMFGNAETITLGLHHEMLAGAAGSTTLKIRVGGRNAATKTFNGKGGSRNYGGVANSYIRIQEIQA